MLGIAGDRSFAKVATSILNRSDSAIADEFVERRFVE
jgi:hypothetical protein